jgi:hypothetical protein
MQLVHEQLQQLMLQEEAVFAAYCMLDTAQQHCALKQHRQVTLAAIISARTAARPCLSCRIQ